MVPSNPLQYSCLRNPTDRGAWQAIVHGSQRGEHDLVTKQHVAPKLPLAGFSRKIEPIGCVCVCVCVCAYTILDADKSQDPQGKLASWRPS